MKAKNPSSNEDFVQSMNENINSEMYLEELEKRLETDPMLLGNPADASIQLASDFDCFSCTICFSCSEFMV